MPAIPLYLIKLSCSLGLLWLFYRLVLRNLTFYTWNRWYLVTYTLVSFLIPFVNIGPIGGEDPGTQPLIIKYIPVIDEPAAVATQPATHSQLRMPHISWNAWDYALLAVTLGSCLLFTRFLLRWHSLKKMRRHVVLLQEGPIRIFRIPQPIAPFSFGNAIYINPDQHNQKEWEEIILHEYIHIRQRHTIDILVGEFLVITNWYNPFAWLIRYSIRQNLEFIADRAVLENGCDKKGYQYHLLKVVGQNRYRLANNFNFSSLKKRIIMMNKIRSARLHLLRFLFVLPLLTVLLVAFRERFPLHKNSGHYYVNAVGIVISLSTKTPLPGVLVRDEFSGLHTVTDANGYYKLKIPFAKDSVDVHLDFTGEGYEATFMDRSWPALRQTTGLFHVAALSSPNKHDTAFFLFAPNVYDPPPADPDYEYAAHALQQVLKENKAFNNYFALQGTHPEIGLFYVTEDKQKYLMIHRDGTVERYGYPGTPSRSDMEEKYGQLPGIMNKNSPAASYVARWAAISAQAEKDFHTTSKDVKAVIFPGDSRVIAVPASGKPEIYDMENDDPKERPAFEALYGPLPACVPAPSLHTRPTLRPSARTPATEQQTLAVGSKTRDTSKPQFHMQAGRTYPDFHKTLWIVDGVIKPQGWYNIDSLNALDITSMDVYDGDKAKTLFGDKAPDGAVFVVTRSNFHPRIHVAPTIPSIPQQDSVLYIVDGKPVSHNAVESIPPSTIQSVSVFKKQGVVLITTK